VPANRVSTWWAGLRRREAQSRLDAESAAAREAILVSVIATAAGNPKFKALDMSAFDGLLSVQEVQRDYGSVELRCRWDSEKAANHGERSLAQALGLSGATRETIGYVKVRPKARWRRLLNWGYVAGVLGSFVAISANLEEIRTFLVKLSHKPEITLESLEPLLVAADIRESRIIILRGDSFFRTGVSNFVMHLEPDPESKLTRPLDHDGLMAIPMGRRSIDVSETLELPVPFDRLPAGDYLMTLNGKVSSGWHPRDFGPTQAVKVQVRKNLALARVKLIPWKPQPDDPTRSTRALVDLDILFGRSAQPTLDVRIVIPGQWIGYEVLQSPPPTVAKRESQNAAADPADVIFSLAAVPSISGARKGIRIELVSPRPLTEAEWDEKTKVVKILKKS
jgi:hypothetical protein